MYHRLHTTLTKKFMLCQRKFDSLENALKYYSGPEFFKISQFLNYVLRTYGFNTHMLTFLHFLKKLEFFNFLSFELSLGIIYPNFIYHPMSKLAV